jgi:4,5-dihydroxyphthalate decarboxylase
MATAPRLKIALGTYGHTAALKDGRVKIAGVDPDFVEVVPIIGAFRRMVRDLEFDVCEMAPTTYMIARGLGAPYIALPVFLMRRFHHGGFVTRPDSGIRTPKDLEGKRVGVRAYSVTTGVWTRGIFVNEYGLDSSKVTWVVDDEEHVTALKLPPNVVHTPDGKSLADMMDNGELSAGFTGNAGIGRSGSPTGGWQQRSSENYPELIPNVAQTEADWFKRTGIYPIHGSVVVKTEALEKHPHLAKSLVDAFVAAKAIYMDQLKAGKGETADDKKYRGLATVVGDPLPYGMKENAASIDAMLNYGLQQGLIPRRMALGEAFVNPA